MARWNEFAAAEPQYAADCRALIYQFGVGLAFLSTVRADGGPRIHPICPVFSDLGLHGFIVPSPKQRDLLRDGRFALHSFPCPDNEDAAYLTGRVNVVDDEPVRSQLAAQFVSERAQFGVPAPTERDLLVEFDLDTVMITRTTGHGDPVPAHSIWTAPARS